MDKTKNPSSKNQNPYIPFMSEILEIKQETSSVKSFLLQIPKEASGMVCNPGQFFQLSLPGVGEIPVGISNFDPKKNTLLFCIAKLGVVTSKLHSLEVGDQVGIRGPYGNGFPMQDWKKKNLILVAGGMGLVPLRSVIEDYFRNQNEYGELEVLYGARNSQEIIFKQEMKEWRMKKKTTCKITIDKPEKGWDGNTGFVCNLVDSTYCDCSEVLFHSVSNEKDNTVILIVGPPVMFNTVLDKLNEINFPDESVYLSLENHMKCGIGKCGHCNCGSKYICQDGPVFSWKELKSMKPEF